jgi:transposase InsO family protein
MQSKGHKPTAYHPWTYTTWKTIRKGKENFWDYYRYQARQEKISPAGLLRLEWIIFYYTVGKQNTTKTAQHFGISRQGLHKWIKRFDKSNAHCLEEYSRKPKKFRGWQVTKTEEEQIVVLRKANMEFGKQKLKILYKQHYKEDITTWKIERVIRKHNLFVQKKKKRVYTVGKAKQPRIRIHKVKETLKKLTPGTLWHTDSILIWWYGQRRVIFTALEDKTKLAYARVYTTASSQNGSDFLRRLRYVSGNQLAVIHSDNGSEFAKTFADTCNQLGIQQIFSRPHTPKDNPALEKFNHTVQREWLDFSEVGLDDIQEANRDLTEWLVKYSSIRPHQALDYLTPLAYASQIFKVSTMSPANSVYCTYGI